MLRAFILNLVWINLLRWNNMEAEIKQIEKPESKKPIAPSSVPSAEGKKKPTKAHKEKEKAVKEFAEQIQKAKTLMVVNIKGLPSSQFQSIKKELRAHAQIKVAKKNILKRVIKALGKESALGLEKEIQENCAFAISDLEGFELAGILAHSKTPLFAKAGQEAVEDIEVKAGPTSLLPGPAISELGSLGLQVAVENGKISIKASKVVVNKGRVINANAASLFQKLDIKPFNIGLEPIAVYDLQTEKIYTNIKINPEQAIKDLKSAAGKALGFAQKIVYYCKETIAYFLAKANAGEQALEKLSPAESESNPTEKLISSQKQSDEEDKQSPKEQEDNKTEENKESVIEKVGDKIKEVVEDVKEKVGEVVEDITKDKSEEEK